MRTVKLEIITLHSDLLLELRLQRLGLSLYERIHERISWEIHVYWKQYWAQGSK